VPLHALWRRCPSFLVIVVCFAMPLTFLPAAIAAAAAAPETTLVSAPSGSTTSTTASISFTSSAWRRSTFDCRLDGGSWARCTSPKTYTQLPVGDHVFNVRATNKSGVTDPTPATASWTIAPPPPRALPDAPPPCGDASHACVDLDLPAGTGVANHVNLVLDDSKDYRLHLPTGGVSAGINLRGGRNITMIGGQIDLPTDATTHGCNDASGGTCPGIVIYGRGSSGPRTVFIEGVYIRNPNATTKNTSDGIRLENSASNPTTLIVQNTRIEGISGCDPSDSDAHADVFQPYDAPGSTIRFHNVSATTNCQAFQVEPDLAWSNLGTTSGPQSYDQVNVTQYVNQWGSSDTQMYFWLTYGGGSSCAAAVTTLSHVYVNTLSDTLVGHIWPDTNRPSGCLARYDATTRTMTFPSTATHLMGSIVEGAPPTGDFVPPPNLGGNVGRDYVTPGYQ
jgi:hypothetical protein